MSKKKTSPRTTKIVLNDEELRALVTAMQRYTRSFTVDSQKKYYNKIISPLNKKMYAIYIDRMTPRLR